jgi:tetratricopeptide (TPR) repeat protein
MDNNDGPMAAKLDRLISKGRFYRAHAEAEEYIHGTTQTAHADIWFQYVLALLLLDKKADSAVVGLRNAPGFTSVMEGDLRRDYALQAIRLGKFDQATDYLESVPTLHHSDQNRIAVFWLAKARLALAQGQIGMAHRNFAYADALLLELQDKANSQWALNLRFHWYKFSVATGGYCPYRPSRLMRLDPSMKRKVQYCLMMVLGRVGMHIGNWLERVGQRVYSLLP